MDGIFFGPDGSPLSKPEDVIRFLGKQEKHWKEDRSAYQTAHSWFAANGLPFSIQEILKTDPAFYGATLQKAFFEKKTKLDSYGRESQTDVLALVNTNSGLTVLGVEAKVDESFGPIIHEWNDYSLGKLKRLTGLLDRLKLKFNSTGWLRYQLLHRTVAILIEAETIGARNAALIVQSFDVNRAGFEDFAAFSNAFGTPVCKPSALSNARKLGGVNIRLGWTENQLKILES